VSVVDKLNMIEEHWWNYTDKVKANCHFVYHSSLTIWHRKRTFEMKGRPLTACTEARRKKARKHVPETTNY
jgi:hypothetical protein